MQEGEGSAVLASDHPLEDERRQTLVVDGEREERQQQLAVADLVVSERCSRGDRESREAMPAAPLFAGADIVVGIEGAALWAVLFVLAAPAHLGEEIPRLLIVHCRHLLQGEGHGFVGEPEVGGHG